MTNPYELAERAADELRYESGVDAYDVAVVLGSGWREAGAELGEPWCAIPMIALSGFVAPTVAGHAGEVLSVDVDGRKVALLAGRVHLYEVHSAAEVVHPVRTLIAAGAKKVVLTNASGGIDPSIQPGNVVVLRDHLNLTATSPLEGAAPPEGYGERFVDLTDLYSRRLRRAVHDVEPGLSRGGLRRLSRPALRDAGRGRDGAHHGRDARGHVDGPRGDRRASHEGRGARAEPRLQLRRRCQ